MVAMDEAAALDWPEGQRTIQFGDDRDPALVFLCLNCGKRLDGGNPMTIGPDGEAYCPECAVLEAARILGVPVPQNRAQRRLLRKAARGRGR